MHKGVELGALIASAKAGNADAQYEIGRVSLLGPRTEKQEMAAQKWFRQAARQGHAKAKRAVVYQVNSGLCSCHDEEIAQWTLDMAVQGDARGQYLQSYSSHCDEQSRIDWLVRSANQEYVPAMVELGYRMANGWGLEHDMARAIKCFKGAALQGNLEAQCLLGKIYSGGYGVEPDYSKAIDWLAKPLEKELGHAFVTMGCILEARDGKQGCKKAMDLYRWAHERGRWCPVLNLEPIPNCRGPGEASYRMGRLYHEGRGVTQNDKQAAEWYAEAAKEASMLRYPVNYLDAIGLAMRRAASDPNDCLRAAKAGNADAQVEYGLRKMNITCGVAMIDRAARWIEKAARQGHALGQYAWGGILETVSEKKDIRKIAGWYQKSAEQGFAEGQAELGRYYRGKNYFASRLFCRRLPSGQWDEWARFEFGLFIDRRPDNKRAAEWYLLASERGLMPAQFELGEMYASGQGVNQNFGEAAKWLRKAIEWTYKDWSVSIRQRFAGKWQAASGKK